MTTDLSNFVTLLVTVDPVGLAPVFLAITPGLNRQQRVEVAVRATIIAFCVLVFFAIAGAPLLQLLGISLPAFHIAGGILLFWIAFEMVFDLRADRKQSTAEIAVTQDHIRNVAAFPLAIPLMAGPGAITATILIAGRTGGEIVTLATLCATIGVVMFLALAAFLAASRLSDALGATGNIVLTRLLGIILAGLAVQFVVNGAQAIART